MPGVAAGRSDVCKAWLLGTVMYARRGCWAQWRMQGVAAGRSDVCKAWLLGAVTYARRGYWAQ